MTESLEAELKSLVETMKNKKFNEFGVIFENLYKNQNNGHLKEQTEHIVEMLQNKNNEDFLIALPRLIESSETFKKMFLAHPQAQKILKQSIEAVKNANFRHKHGVLDKEVVKKHTETQKGHILVLEHLLNA